ncbi:hypothetical protein BDBG_17961 [Blastomyces gilchristii SLH14081]|uniref:Uncharacterized protein n=2 Tax=Blastomyces TaxID=229219 RepID=A0A179V124_BLAGS|nr:uncharacterized protein BDBG_17961 [Blastomyces gilchristii SLH14081]KMW69154.1 hypothetical protein BDDG_13322 [Blastomyces dermatitidis ATCC 18188]OAT14036.1 hypothetical protein BDBG_17961 [Blastomyces gilchristii SLH14081]
MDRLANLDLNGREIKNLMSIAHALATDDGGCVNYKYIEQASVSNEEYSREFNRKEVIQCLTESRVNVPNEASFDDVIEDLASKARPLIETLKCGRLLATMGVRLPWRNSVREL